MKKMTIAVLLTALFLSAVSVSAADSVLTLTFEDASVPVTVHADSDIDSVLVREAPGGDFGGDLLSGEEAGKTDGRLLDLCFAGGEDKIIVYGLDLSALTDLEVYADEEGVSWSYKDEAGEEVSTKDHPIVSLDKAQELYASTGLNVRSIPDASGEKLGTLSRAEKVSVLGKSGNWALIPFKDGYGYVSMSYLAETEPAPEAAAEAAGYDDYSYDYGYDYDYDYDYSYGGGNGGVYVVSQENLAGCDDPNHGVTVITYSDGTYDEIPY